MGSENAIDPPELVQRHAFTRDTGQQQLKFEAFFFSPRKAANLSEASTQSQKESASRAHI